MSDLELLSIKGNKSMPSGSAQKTKRQNSNGEKRFLLSQLNVNDIANKKNIYSSRKKLSLFKSSALLFCLFVFLSQSTLLPLAFAQTMEPPAAAGGGTGSMQPDGQARSTEGTVRNPYPELQEPVIDESADINTKLARRNVKDILVGERSTLVYQAAEQKMNGFQDDISNMLNKSLGSVNETYRGLHQFYKDDIVGRLFSEVGQLVGKWIQELIDGWISDTAIFLAKILRIFVLNPNIAINGLNGSPDDQISSKVRQAGDIMYGIAIDLLLLLFILAIWKYWAEAAWRGGGNLMGAVGRLIFTSGLMLAWPTLFAFEVQITNEMIKAIYFNSAGEIIALENAIGIAIKGGLLAGIGGVVSVFAPIGGGLAGGAIGGTVGEVIGFFGLVTFLILGGILIAELVYIIILKAIQTALITAQYMFGPVFLVFFATPSTENIATGFVRSFVETSLWTFVWVGLLKIMVILMASPFNPWGKILMSIGILQIMIQVPSFLARAQISPMSDFISAGLVSGGLLKMLGWMGNTARNRIGQAFDYNLNQKYGARGFANTTGVSTDTMARDQQNPELLSTLAQKTKDARDAKSTVNTPPKTPVDPNGQQIKTPLTAKQKQKEKEKNKQEEQNAAAEAARQGKDVTTPETNPATGTSADVNAGTPDHSEEVSARIKVPPKAKTAAAAQTATATKGAKNLATAASVAGAAGAVAAAAGAGTGITTPGGEKDKEPEDKYQLPNYGFRDWDEKYFKYVPARFAIAALTSLQGLSIRYGNPDDPKDGNFSSGIVGDGRNGSGRIWVGKNANNTEVAHTMLTAAFANGIRDPQGHDAARQASIDAGEDGPKGFWENVGANWLSYGGASFKQTGRAKERFAQGIFKQAALGSAAYVNGDNGNAYTKHLIERYGDWTKDNDAIATFIITDPDSTESPWNRAIGPATDALIGGGFSISPDTRGAAQNPAIMAMHPSRRKLAIPAVLKATYSAAQDMCKDLDPEKLGGQANVNSVLKHVHGELARGLSGGEVDWAMSIDAMSDGHDLNATNAYYGAQFATAMGATTGEGYPVMRMAAPYIASSMGAFGQTNGVNNAPTASATVNLDGLRNAIGPENYAKVMERTVDLGRAFQANGISLRQLADPDFASSLYHYVDDNCGLASIDSPQGQTVMQAGGMAAKQLGSVGFTTSRANAAYQILNNGGNVGQLSAKGILAGERIIQGGAAPTEPMVETYIRLEAESGGRPVAIEQVQRVASEFDAGHANNYKHVPIVARLVANNIPVNQHSINLGAQEYAVSGGASINPDHITKVLPQYMAGNVRDYAQSHVVAQFIDASSSSNVPINQQSVQIAIERSTLNNSNDIGGISGAMKVYSAGIARNASEANAIFNNCSQIASQMMPNMSTEQLGQSIIEIQNAGGFTPQQWKDPTTVRLALTTAYENHGSPSSNVMELQCLQVATRVFGAEAVASNPTRYMTVYRDMLDNGFSAYQAVQSGQQGFAAAESIVQGNNFDWDDNPNRRDVHASPGNVRVMIQDSGYNPSSSLSSGKPVLPSQDTWDKMSLPRERGR